MKAIHGGKTKNDRQDAHTLAVLLRGGMFPQAYVYPKQKRATALLLPRSSARRAASSSLIPLKRWF